MKVKHSFNTNPEKVFEAWLNSDLARDWWFRTPGGQLQLCEIDGRTGGRFRIVEKRGPILAEHFGTFLELQRPARIIFEFATSVEQAPTRVSILITKTDSGCELSLSHSIDPQWESFRDRISAGWKMILENLSESLNHPDNK